MLCTNSSHSPALACVRLGDSMGVHARPDPSIAGRPGAGGAPPSSWPASGTPAPASFADAPEEEPLDDPPLDEALPSAVLASLPCTVPPPFVDEQWTPAHARASARAPLRAHRPAEGLIVIGASSRRRGADGGRWPECPSRAGRRGPRGPQSPPGP